MIVSKLISIALFSTFVQGNNVQRRLTIGMCRASCIETLQETTSYNEDCFSNQQCKRCWQMCSYSNERSIMNLFCLTNSNLMCPSGCRTACTFNSTAIMPTSTNSLAFTPKIQAINETALKISWNSPESTSSIVNVLFWKFADNDKWNFVLSTVSNFALMQGRHRQYPQLAFRVVAVTESGILADKIIHFDDHTDLQSQTTSSRFQETTQISTFESASSDNINHKTILIFVILAPIFLISLSLAVGMYMFRRYSDRKQHTIVSNHCQPDYIYKPCDFHDTLDVHLFHFNQCAA